MGEIDFEAEARAWLDLDDAENEEWIERSVTLAAKLREADVRARSEGEADGYRRGVEAATVWMRNQTGLTNTADRMSEALLPPEPAKCTRPVGSANVFCNDPACPIHGAQR